MASRILLADDSITIQKVVNLTFADEGIEVVAVNNGDVAERRLAEVKPDLVLADIFMPGKNGYELCEAIKDSAQFRNVPVVLLVGAFEPFDQVEARRVRADAHLTKPFESRTLVETVRRLISASPRTTTGPIAPMPTADDEHDQAFDARAVAGVAAPLAPQLADSLDVSAMAGNNGSALTPSVGTTGELASPALVAQQEVYDLGVVDAPPLDAFSATLTDTSERFESLEFSPNGDFSPADITPPFDLVAQDQDSQEMIQDFETPAAVETVASQDPISFETGPGDSLNVDVTGAPESDRWFNHASSETTNLNRPSGDSAWRAPSNGSPLSYQTPDFSMQTETGYSESEASTETACATLLAGDDPLGDVLFDEAVSQQLAASEMSSSDLLGLESIEPPIADAAPDSTQFDLVDLGHTPTPEATFAIEEPAATVEVKPEAVEVSADIVEHLAADETPTPEGEVDSAPAEQSFDFHPASPAVDDGSDWTTPRAAAYSTAQLDSVVMPMATAEYLEEKSESEPAQEPETAEEASFTTPAMWTEEEARFTPIDIEAVAVEEALPEAASVSATGFEFSSVPDEPPVENGENPVAANAEVAGNEPTAAALSSLAIEEIVRRVVAEMSESVVREVAWEVVPDCVERVIEQLTRESLSKRA